MNGNRGAKGSINDRLISMMYRRRYLNYMKKMESYNKKDRERQKEYLQKIQNFDIDSPNPDLDRIDKATLQEIMTPLTEEPLPLKEQSVGTPDMSSLDRIEAKPVLSEDDLNTLINLGKNVTPFDPQSEKYDFANYDYYEVLYHKTAVGKMPDDEIIDVDREIAKKDDEITIIEEVSSFVDKSKELLSEIKFGIDDIKNSVSEVHTKEQVEELDAKYQELRAKITKLKAQYEVMKDKYNFEDYAILDSIALLEAVEDYRDKAQLDELEMMVNVCKNEVEEIDDVLAQEKRSIEAEEEIKAKGTKIDERDQQFNNTQNNVIYLDSFEKQLSEEAEYQRKIIQEMWEHLSKVETEVIKRNDYVFHTGKMFASFLRITAGILTAPLNNRRIFGVMLGAGLINHGLKDLRASLIPEQIKREEIREKYNSIEHEILATQDVVSTTMKLIDDSLKQITEIREDFKNRFSPYAAYIPDYSKVEKMMDELEKNLQKKKEHEVEMRKTLDKQYEKNKQRVLRAS